MTFSSTTKRGAPLEQSIQDQLIPQILVVDDEPLIQAQLNRLLKANNYGTTAASSAEEALERLKIGDIDLVVSDVRLPGMSGVDLTKRIKEFYPDVPIILITGYVDAGTAVDALKLGASDYIAKPFSATAIQESVQNVLAKASVFTEIRHLRSRLKEKCEFSGMLSTTPEMHQVFEVIRMASATDITVLVEGETGTGKELVASAIHYNSPRHKGPLVSINCAGIPETLLESELFGFERGAFTGAVSATAGKVELSHGGTLFLDEIESMPLSMQAKLLRVLETRMVQRLGGTKKIEIDNRVIAASNVPLKELVENGKMRCDFYYRINVLSIRLAPLRHRRNDIPLLVHGFLRHHSEAQKRGVAEISSTAMRKLLHYDWPGNIRELQNVVERAIVLAKGRAIENVDLPDAETHGLVNQQASPQTLTLHQKLTMTEKDYLTEQLHRFKGNITMTARASGVDVKTLYRKMRLHALDKKDFYC